VTAARFTYRRLVELVGGDDDLIVHLVDEGVIELCGDDRVTLEVDWSGIPIILRLRAELALARRRIAELEAASGRERPDR
jgi:hypothetical protein